MSDREGESGAKVDVRMGLEKKKRVEDKGGG